MDIAALDHVHCIGIGGIGISGVAKFLHAKGISVSGSDAKQSMITDGCKALGIDVKIVHDAGNIPEATDLVIYTEAASEENLERLEAKRRNIVQLGHFDFLGELSRSYRTICVTGTNGKSTTTAMTAKIFIDAGLDPTILVGSLIPDWTLGNARVGESDILILEGDEYKQKMVKLWPEVTVITNIEEDHLDVYRDLEHIIQTFQEIATKTTKAVILNREDANSQQIIADHIERYDVSAIGDIALLMPGKYNRMNAAAAASVARIFGIADDVIFESLKTFSGLWRRFERVGSYTPHPTPSNPIPVISDYGHHPTAIKAALQGAREFFSDRRIVLLFEPHQHNRTKELFSDFAQSFGGADVLVLSEIYGVLGRTEDHDESVTSQALLDAAMRSSAAPKEGYCAANLDEAEKKLREIIKEGDVVIVMGAGDVDRVARNLVKT